MTEEERIALFRQNWAAIQQDYLLNGLPPASTIVKCAAMYQAYPSIGSLGIMMAAFDEWLDKRSEKSDGR